MTTKTKTALEPLHIGSYSTRELAVIACPSCGDLALVDGGQRKCDACVDYDGNNARLLFERLAKPTQRRGRGMNDDYNVLCDVCGEVAASFPGDVLAENLEGKAHQCESCHTFGKFWFDDENVQINFRRYTQRELSDVASEL